MRTLGFIVFVGAVVGGVLYIGGYFKGDVKVEMTDKGRDAVNDGLEGARKGLNTGLEKLKVENAPKLKAGDE